MEVINYISVHWLEWLFAIITAILGFGYRSILHKLQEEKQRNEAIAKGVQSLLRDSIITNYNKYNEKGYCPVFAKENVKRAYKAYAALGGNDVAHQLYEKMLDMPTEPEV